MHALLPVWDPPFGVVACPNLTEGLVSLTSFPQSKKNVLGPLTEEPNMLYLCKGGLLTSGAAVPSSGCERTLSFQCAPAVTSQLFKKCIQWKQATRTEIPRSLLNTSFKS